MLTQTALGTASAPGSRSDKIRGDPAVRSQTRQVRNLSQGLRNVQVRVRLLCDQYNSAFSDCNDSMENIGKLVIQYQSIGAALKDLVEQWELGKEIWKSMGDQQSHSQASSKRLSTPLSPASSLSGKTAVEGSPLDALRALDGGRRSVSHGSAASSVSEEQIFEAVAQPRQQSRLSREERISKMREDRNRQMAVKEKAQAKTHLLRELETVIKLRPRGRTAGRVTSV